MLYPPTNMTWYIYKWRTFHYHIGLPIGQLYEYNMSVTWLNMILRQNHTGFYRFYIESSGMKQLVLKFSTPTFLVLKITTFILNTNHLHKSMKTV